MKYSKFLEDLDIRLNHYFDDYKDYICCQKGCSSCCKKGDYPISQVEPEYLMQGYISLENNIKQKVQNNVSEMQRGGACPFLIDKECSPFRGYPVS